MQGKKKPISGEMKAIRAATRDEAAAYEFMEARRWGGKPRCPACASEDVYQMKAKDGSAREKNFRWRCRGCERMFSVRSATVMESSRLPLRCWVHAFWRACASKKGVAALQIQRELDINYKSALFLLNRVRLAMSEWAPPGTGSGPSLHGGDGTGSPPPDRLGRDGKTVEADETYVGGKSRPGSGEVRKPVAGRARRRLSLWWNGAGRSGCGSWTA